MLKIQTEATVDIFVRCHCGSFLACTSTLTNGENGENARIDVAAVPCAACCDSACAAERLVKQGEANDEV